jgi:hypothetical protein
MKKALLIATTFTLMALSLPAQAIQLNQVNQDQLSQQTQLGQGTTSLCNFRNRKGC